MLTERLAAVVAVAAIAITLAGAVLRLWRMNELWLSADEALFYVSTLGDWAGSRKVIDVKGSTFNVVRPDALEAMVTV